MPSGKELALEPSKVEVSTQHALLLRFSVNQRMMKYLLSLTMALVCLVFTISAQDIASLEKKLKTAGDADKAMINNQLAELYLRKDRAKAIQYAKDAYKYASSTGNKRVKAESKNFEAKATAGIYLPGKTVPNHRDKNASHYHKGVSLFKESLKLAKAAGYTQLELDNLENLAYINTKTIGRHRPDTREEMKYYKQYITRIKEIKNVTAPRAAATLSGGGGSSSSSNNSNTSNTNNGTPTTGPSTARLIREKKELEEEVGELESETRVLKKQVKTLEDKLKESSGVSTAELENIRKELEEKESELSKVAREKSRKEGETKRLTMEIEGVKYELVQAEEAAEMAEVKASRIQQGVIMGGIIAALVLGFLYFAYRSQSRARKEMAEKNAIIAKEQERSEELLLNILPANIAEELKANGEAKARKHDNVTVLFSDFKNFTAVSEALSPEQLVKELDYCFKGFDFIISQYKSIEKIKTIGDAYMAVSGLGDKSGKHEEDMIKAALDMQEFLEDYKTERKLFGLPTFEARIGIHTGPVVSGVVGNKKFAYDVWGDTVNVASRMESNGEIGKVNISADTYNKVRYAFNCSPRGKIEVKNKGRVEMYFVNKAYS